MAPSTGWPRSRGGPPAASARSPPASCSGTSPWRCSASSAACCGCGVMAESTMLNWLLWLPVVTMAVIALLPKGRDEQVRLVTLACMVVQFVIALVLYRRFADLEPGLQFATDVPWIASWGVHYRIGLDGLN